MESAEEESAGNQAKRLRAGMRGEERRGEWRREERRVEKRGKRKRRVGGNAWKHHCLPSLLELLGQALASSYTKTRF